MPTLSAYLVASQDEPQCWLWLRDSGGMFATDPTTVEGHDKVIRITRLGVSIDLAEVYRGIGTTA